MQSANCEEQNTKVRYFPKTSVTINSHNGNNQGT